LNSLPILNETAQRWLQDGLKGGQAEFLEQPWGDDDWDQPTPRKEIGNGGEEVGNTVPTRSPYRLEHMKLGPKLSFLCLIPPPLEPVATTPSEEDKQAEAQLDPLSGWSLLQPLEGRCLYHRQAWFTYSYCHGSRVRQFHEAPHTHPHPPGGYVPEEDPEWDSYTLGEAPPTPEPGAELTPAQQHAISANLELAHAAGARYLVQRWGGGSVCDKTGRRREIEVQFHCSPTSTDTILFVKEVRTCSYVLVIHTPRLCSVPGFRSRLDAHAHEQVRCREIVSEIGLVDKTRPDTDYPLRLPPRPQPSLPQPSKEQPVVPKGHKHVTTGPGVSDDTLKQALSLLFGEGGEGGDASRVHVQKGKVEGEYLIELLDDDDVAEAEDGHGYLQGAGPGDDPSTTREALLKLLKGAGFDVSGYGVPPEEKGRDKKKKQEQPSQEKMSHDEMEEEDEDDFAIFRDEL
jgi:protein OS-9